MLVLDTDHVSTIGLPSQDGLRLLERIESSGQEAATTIITVEEQLRGWLAEIHRLADLHRQVLAYERLQQRIDFFASWTVLPWSSDAANVFMRMRREGVRIGSMDLNTPDFSKVPLLHCENWLA